MSCAATSRSASGLPRAPVLALVLLACAPAGPPDALADRCAEVLALQHFALARTEWHVVSQRGRERTLRFEAVRQPDGAPLSDTIRCVFEPGEPWRLERAVVGGRILSEAELALVNADLLLRDLAEPPPGAERSRGAS